MRAGVARARTSKNPVLHEGAENTGRNGHILFLPVLNFDLTVYFISSKTYIFLMFYSLFNQKVSYNQ